MAHTPGPWEVDEQEGVIFNRELGINICAVYPFNRKDNAHLIAAAPDLLGALTNLITFLSHVGFSPADAIDEELKDAQAAIDKAEGKANG